MVHKKRKAMLSVWDTAGQERFKTSIAKNYFKKAKAVIIAYDCSDKSTFDNIDFWMKEVENNCEESIAKLIIGKFQKSVIITILLP